jgi:LPS-assembly protein
MERAAPAKKPKVRFQPDSRPIYWQPARLACPVRAAFASRRVIRRIALFIALACASAARAAPDPQPAAVVQSDLSGDRVSVDEATGETVLTGRATLVDPDYLLNSDEIRFNQKTQVAVASGNVTLTRIGDRILADSLTIHRRDGTFSAVNLRIGKFPFYIQGPTAEGSKKDVVIHDATVTYGEPGRWQPSVHAKSITY